MKYKPVVLVIMDGWGVAPGVDGNAITQADTPNFTKFLKNYPTMTVHASGNEVGLLFGEMGNSEVGHLNIGAGRVYYQNCTRINRAIDDNSFFENLEISEETLYIFVWSSQSPSLFIIGVA